MYYETLWSGNTRFYYAESVYVFWKQSVNDDLVYRLRKRAEIRRQIPSRKSVQEGAPDRIADLLEEAANEIDRLKEFEWMYKDLQK
jgi:hypothetical protein